MPLLLGALVACSDDPEPAADDPLATALQPGAPGEDNTVVSTVDDADVMGEVTEADETFVQHMVVHHAQALEMVELAEGRLTDDEVSAIAARIEAAQQPEISTMARWLVEQDLPVPVEAESAGVDIAALGGEPMEDMSGMDAGGMEGMDMPGMASSEELDALGSATGPEAETMFLELMIAHHEGALTMTTEQATDGRDVLLGELANEMFVEQQAEIGRMQEMQDRLSAD